MHTPFELRYSTHYIFIRPFNATLIFVLELIICAGRLLYISLCKWNNMTRFPYMPHLMQYAFIICNGIDTYIIIITLVHKILSLWNRKAVLSIEVCRELISGTQCETELFDEDYIKEVFKNMCSHREHIFSDAEHNISSAQTRMKADYDKKKGKSKV